MKLSENNINEFLWTCAGVNKEILRLYPNEYAKYAGSGGTILFTAIMAMISGGYAMYFVFKSAIIAFIFAIFWGLLIFNLDRFIVNSMYTDGKDTLSWRKLKSALPRIIMAIFLGIVISTPLEMKIFNDRIESQLLKDNIERINEAKNKSGDYTELSALQEEYKKYTAERLKYASELQKAQKELKDEAEGNALSGQAGHGAIYKDKEIYVNQCKQTLDEWDKTYGDKVKSIQLRINELNKHVTQFEGKVDNLQEDGFSARYEAFANLKDNNMSLNIVSLMITLLFIIIEITPTFFKLIMISGPYEEHAQLENYKVQTLVDKEKTYIDGELTLIKAETNKKLNNKLNLTIEPSIQKNTIIYGSSSRKIINQNTKDIQHLQKAKAQHNIIEADVVPYKFSTNTTITANKKRQTSNILENMPKNKRGQIVLNFASKNKDFLM